MHFVVIQGFGSDVKMGGGLNKKVCKCTGRVRATEEIKRSIYRPACLALG